MLICINGNVFKGEMDFVSFSKWVLEREKEISELKYENTFTYTDGNFVDHTPVIFESIKELK